MDYEYKCLRIKIETSFSKVIAFITWKCVFEEHLFAWARKYEAKYIAKLQKQNILKENKNGNEKIGDVFINHSLII